MESELAQLAASGATTLTGLMVSDAWSQVRDRISRFFAHADVDEDRYGDQLQAAETDAAAVEAGRLDRTRTELLEARDVQDAELEEELRNALLLRLRQILRADPVASTELRALLREVDPDASAAAAGMVVHNTINDGVYGIAIQAGSINGGVTAHHGAPAAAPRTGPRSWD